MNFNFCKLQQKSLCLAQDNNDTPDTVTDLLYYHETKSCALAGNVGCYLVEEIISCKDVVLVTDITQAQEGGVFVIGKQAYANNGKYLGVVTDAKINCKMQLKNLVINNCLPISASKIACVQDIVLIKVPRNKPQSKQQNTKDDKPLLAQTNDTETAKKQEIEPKSEHTSCQNCTFEQKSTKQSNVVLPLATQQSTKQFVIKNNMLLNKIVDKTFVNLQGETILHKGGIITNSVIAQAKVAGKLYELFLHSHY